MKPILVTNSKVPRWLSIFMEIEAITIYPFIFFRGWVSPDLSWNNSSKILYNHEMIHIKQYEELWVIGFFIVYAYDFIKGLLKYGDFEKAYKHIRMEKEAYNYQDNSDYLNHRKKFSWK